MKTRLLASFFVGLLILPSLFWGGGFVQAQSEVDKLRDQIAERNERLSQIEDEIAQYEAELQKVGAEKSTLQSAINQLELERKKVLADINYTETKISATDVQISKLSYEISSTTDGIGRNSLAIAEILRSINENDRDSLLEVFLRTGNVSDFWNEVESLDTVRQSVKEKVEQLSVLKTVLEEKKGEQTNRKADLISLKEQYTGQQLVLEGNKKEKNQLLTATKNEEAEYQRQLAAKKAAKEQLLKEVQDIESQLQYILDPNSIPSKGSAVFDWPLNNVIITQYFGYTKFALSGAYNGKAHNGMDFGASVGTKIFAPLNGTVRATGNTDLVPGCYSWGQWALIDHPNGLSTLYAHMSWTGVSTGQKVATGDVIGYVGATGYATGPHLHFTVYVSDAVSVKKFSEFKAVTACGAALSPFSAVEGYLDPLDYLPSL